MKHQQMLINRKKKQMANIRQYIGARYVFKIYENSTDPSSAEWESGVTYEPLTIVTYLNSTYASKKDVPGSVGNPAANPTYWIVTGAYNGQIAALQQQIDTINNTDLPNINSAIQTLTDDINAIETQIGASDKKYIIIGDSYSSGYGNVDLQGWFYWLKYYLNLTDDVNIFNSNNVRTGGFVDDGTVLQSDGVNRGFLGQIYWLRDNLNETVRKSITDILIFGGMNDIDATEETLSSHMTLFNNVVTTSFPNAKVTIAYIGGSKGATAYFAKFSSTSKIYKKYAAILGWKYLNNSEYVSRDAELYTDTGSGVSNVYHPNNYEQITLSLIEGLYNDTCQSEISRQQTITMESGYTIASNVFSAEYRSQNLAQIIYLPFSIVLDTPVSGHPFAGGIKIGTLSNNALTFPTRHDKPVTLIAYDNGNLLTVSGVIRITEAYEVYLIIDYCDGTIGNYHNFTSLTRITLQTQTDDFLIGMNC
jgi:hypothetical protein